MVSIIIPVYNCEKYIEKCITAIKAQTYRSWELILVDDCSSDNSLNIMNQSAKNDSRISVLFNDFSEGAGPARNKGIDAASGEYIMFIDADDFPEPDMLEKLVANADLGFELVIGGYKSFVEGVNFEDTFCMPETVFRTANDVRSFFAETFPGGMAGYLWNKIYRKDVIKKHNIRFPDMRRLQDGMFNIDYFAVISSCMIIPDTIYNYRINPQTDIFRKIPKNYFSLIKQFTNKFINTASSWSSFSDKRISVFFLEECSTCIENSFSQSWEMDKQQRMVFLRQLQNDGTMELSKKYIESIAAYRRFLISNLTHPFLIHIAIIVKTTLKKCAKKTFYRIKRR